MTRRLESVFLFRRTCAILKSMKNRYPKACSVCQGTVPAGEGTLRRVGAGWSVTHEGGCPRDVIRRDRARARTERVVNLLDRPMISAEDLAECVGALAELTRAGWATRESCERAILSARALRNMDRLEVEEILYRFLTEDSRC